MTNIKIPLNLLYETLILIENSDSACYSREFQNLRLFILGIWKDKRSSSEKSISFDNVMEAKCLAMSTFAQANLFYDDPLLYSDEDLPF